VLYEDSCVLSARDSILLSDATGVRDTIRQRQRVLTTLPVLLFCYFNVCGGPAQAEGIFGIGGPLIGLLALLIFPIIWCLPLGLISTELSTAFPENGKTHKESTVNHLFSSLGGFIVWVYHAFGPFWAFQEGYWTWISNVVSVASFPVMLLNSIELCFEIKLSSGAAYFVQICFVLCCCLPLLLGAKHAGHTMLLLFSVALLPFIIFSCVAFANPGSFGWGVLGQVRESDNTTANYYETLSESSTSATSGIAWEDLLTVVFWNVCNGFTNVSTFVGEVRNPEATYPKALSLAVLAIVLTYVIPLSAAAVYNEPIWATWDIGSFTEIARSLGGNHLLVAIFIASTASTAGLITASVFSCIYVLTGMGEVGLINPVFTKRTEQTYAPWVSWLCSILPTFILMALELDTLLVVTNALSAMSQVFLVAAAVRLRVTHPDVPRPYRVPGNVAALMAWGTPPIIVCGWMIYSVCASDEWIPPLLTLALVVIGTLIGAFTVRRNNAILVNV